MPKQPFAFVLMPFSDEFSDVYNLGIKATAIESGIQAERVDEQTFSELMLDRIYRQIDICDFVIADMSGRNPNVFYEVGYAHARGKLVSLLTQTTDDIPFDLKQHRHIVYGKSIQTLKQKLLTEFAWLKDQLDQGRENTISVTLKKASGVLERSKHRVIAKVTFKLDLKNPTDSRSPEIENAYFYTSNKWKLHQRNVECPSILTEENGRVRLKHFVHLPISRLSPGAWAQIDLVGEKLVWESWTGKVELQTFESSGFVTIEIHTSQGKINQQFHVDVDFDDEIPF